MPYALCHVLSYSVKRIILSISARKTQDCYFAIKNYVEHVIVKTIACPNLVWAYWMKIPSKKTSVEHFYAKLIGIYLIIIELFPNFWENLYLEMLTSQLLHIICLWAKVFIFIATVDQTDIPTSMFWSFPGKQKPITQN